MDSKEAEVKRRVKLGLKMLEHMHESICLVQEAIDPDYKEEEEEEETEEEEESGFPLKPLVPSIEVMIGTRREMRKTAMPENKFELYDGTGMSRVSKPK